MSWKPLMVIKKTVSLITIIFVVYSVFFCAMGFADDSQESIAAQIKLLGSEFDIALKDLSKKISQSEARFDSVINSSSSRHDKFVSISSLWRDLLGEAPKLAVKIQSDKHFKAINRLKTPEVKNKLTEQLEQKISAIQNQQEIVSDRFYLHLNKLSNARAELLDQMAQNNNNLFLSLLADSNDIYYELVAIPSRFIQFTRTKTHDVEAIADKGLAGYFKIFKDLVFFVLSLFIPFFAVFLFRKLAELQAKMKRELWRKRESKYTLIANFIQRFSPYLGWLVAYATLKAISSFWVHSIFEDGIKILPLAFLYVHYRIAGLLFEDVFKLIGRSLNYHYSNYASMLGATFRPIGLFYFFTYSLLYIVEYCTGQVLIFNLLQTVLPYAGIIVTILSFRNWTTHVSQMLIAIPGFPHQKASEVLSYRFGFVFLIPSIFVCIIYAFIHRLISLLSNIDFFKRLFIKLSRSKIELSQSSDQSGATSAEEIREYEKFFSDECIEQYGLISNVFANEFEQISHEINDWINDNEDDHTIAIMGDNGIGKTTVLDRLARRFQSVRTVRIKIEPKVTRNQDLKEALAKAFGMPNEEESCIKLVKNYNAEVKEKVLIIVDDAHHLFISQVDGLTAFRTFLGVISLDTENLFWVVAFNQFAFSYLKGVIGFTQHFRTEVVLGKWSSESIHGLLKSRHELSKYKISYESIGQYALLSDADDVKSKMEYQFYNIIWEQAAGNPRVAMRLWLSSLTKSKFKTLQVSLPERISNEQLMRLDDNAWFVLAAITRHRCLSKKETSEACNFPMPVVSHALIVALDGGIVVKTSNRRYQLSFLYQNDIIKNLKMKNFIL